MMNEDMLRMTAALGALTTLSDLLDDLYRDGILTYWDETRARNILTTAMDYLNPMVPFPLTDDPR